MSDSERTTSARTSSADAGADCLALIMAGGGGTRLWPASTQSRPKQLMSLLPAGATEPSNSLLAATVALRLAFDR